MEEARRKYIEKVRRDDPHAEVMEVKHDFIHEPWPSDRLEAVFQRIVSEIFSFDEKTSDFVVRKTLLRDTEILEFQRHHPRLYYTLTDRAMMKEEKYRTTLMRMLLVKQRIERGEVPADERADALATEAIVTSLLPTDVTQQGRGNA